MILADSNDLQALQRMTAQTKVVISTVGPFAKYGESLIAACCKTGTSYCDITGESPWVESMIVKYGSDRSPGIGGAQRPVMRWAMSGCVCYS